MARYGTLKKNIRRNLRAWGEPVPTVGRDSRAIPGRIVAVFLALSLAGALLPIAANIVFRIPDLYEFDLGRTRAIAETGMEIKDAKVADAISSFLRHRTDSFQAEGVLERHSALLFTRHDSSVMHKLRSFLDNILVIGITSLALCCALYFILVRWGSMRSLRRGFLAGSALYAGLLAAVTLTILFGGPLMRVWRGVIGGDFAADDMMPQIFHKGLFLTAWAAVGLVTLVIMFVLLSVTSRLTRVERMF
jgi:hypothetical protein